VGVALLQALAEFCDCAILFSVTAPSRISSMISRQQGLHASGDVDEESRS
jgi:hypothetical protein